MAIQGTRRTLAYFNDDSTGVLKDNTAGDIGADDLRDFVLTSYFLNFDEVSVTTTATATIDKMHVCSGTSADYTVTLPAISGNTGRLIGIRIATTCTKLITIDGDGSEEIDGATTRIMWAGESALLLCASTGWHKIAGKSIPMSAILRLSADSGYVTPGGLELVHLDSADSDPTGVMADTSNHQINIKRTSNYDVVGKIIFICSGINVRCIAQVRYDATSDIVFGAEGYGASGGFPGIIATALMFPATAGTHFELEGYVNGSANTVKYQGFASLDACFLYVKEVPAW